MTRAWRLCSSAAPRGFTRRVTPAPSQRIKQTSTSYWKSLRELVQNIISVGRDFAACWRSRVTARYSARLKGLSKEQLLIEGADRTDSVTIRFLCRTDSTKLSVNCQP